jgi:hypothetical protein
MELLLAIGLPAAYLVLTTAVLAHRREQRPRLLQRRTARDALLWNTMVAITIAVAALRWALHR